MGKSRVRLRSEGRVGVRVGVEARARMRRSGIGLGEVSSVRESVEVVRRRWRRRVVGRSLVRLVDSLRRVVLSVGDSEILLRRRVLKELPTISSFRSVVQAHRRLRVLVPVVGISSLVSWGRVGFRRRDRSTSSWNGVRLADEAVLLRVGGDGEVSSFQVRGRRGRRRGSRGDGGRGVGSGEVVGGRRVNGGRRGGLMEGWTRRRRTTLLGVVAVGRRRPVVVLRVGRLKRVRKRWGRRVGVVMRVRKKVSNRRVFGRGRSGVVGVPRLLRRMRVRKRRRFGSGGRRVGMVMVQFLVG